MKKLLSLTLALALTLVLASCSDKESTGNENETLNNEQEVVDTVTPETPDEDEADVETDVETDVEAPDVEAPDVETPEVETPEVETPEVDDTPAVMPEVEAPEVDTPAVMPEVETPEVETPEVETPDVETPADDATIDDLYMIADKLYEGINPEEMPMVGTIELFEENFEYSAFVPYKSTYLAVESMPMIGSMPHSVVIVKAESATEAAQLAEDMKANANPRKWVCVNARSVKSAAKGEYAILVMTSVDVLPTDEIDETKAEEMSALQSEERAQTIINNFLAAV